MTTQPCPIYPERCLDPQHCVLGSPCVRQEESLAARLASLGLSGSIKVYNQRNTMDEDERMDQIAALVAKWRATRAYDDLSESRLMGLAAIVVSGSTPRDQLEVESGRDALVAACTALEWATDVLMYISVKLGVNDAKKCRSAAARCDRALTGLIGTAKESPS